VAPGVPVRLVAGGGGRGSPGCGGTLVAPGELVRPQAGRKTCGGSKGGPPVEQKREAACGRHGSGWPREAQGPLSRSGWSPVDVVAARWALGSTVVEGPPGGGLPSSGCPVVCAVCWSSFPLALCSPGGKGGRGSLVVELAGG
jgi:hypothetical protein